MAQVQASEDEVKRPEIKELLEVAEETNALLLALMHDRRLNKANPLASPKPLFNVIDFIRRTYLEYVVPLFPGDAPYKVLEMANPYVFQYPDHSTGVFAEGFTTDMSYLENEANWPEWTPELAELYSDTIGRNVTIAMIMLQGDEKGPLLMQGTFDFETNAVELAKGLTPDRPQVVELKERKQDARMAVGLKG
ncbi:hypothetical protein H2200_008981 [Cladophialophora chaetospira]|uniref:Uncharacterized protein n=1 Tax=Cladophialophora chaetospira TaxID=386627 RepID=A0AA39CG73_9EURO|nr:hypothetical protein H2200_008981 [Cladophialophora chaetospira]